MKAVAALAESLEDRGEAGHLSVTFRVVDADAGEVQVGIGGALVAFHDVGFNRDDCRFGAAFDNQDAAAEDGISELPAFFPDLLRLIRPVTLNRSLVRTPSSVRFSIRMFSGSKRSMT